MIEEIRNFEFEKLNQKEVIINPTIKQIGVGAFEFSNIESIVIPSSVEHIRTSAFKGCKNLKNKLRGVSSKMNYCEYTINYKEKGLSTLIEGTMIDSFKNIYIDMKKAMYSFYLIDLVSQALKENNSKELFIIKWLWKFTNSTVFCKICICECCTDCTENRSDQVYWEESPKVLAS